jgi:lysozyme
MKTSNAGLEAIKRFEALKLKTYRDSAGVLTIGYGHTGKDVTADMTITREHADRLFASDISIVEKQINSRLPVVFLSQNRFDALVSFTFNVGIDALRKSTLWRLLVMNPDDPDIPRQFRRWVYATVNGKKVKLPGLINRRNYEAEMWEGGTK